MYILTPLICRETFITASNAVLTGMSQGALSAFRITRVHFFSVSTPWEGGGGGGGAVSCEGTHSSATEEATSRKKAFSGTKLHAPLLIIFFISSRLSSANLRFRNAVSYGNEPIVICFVRFGLLGIGTSMYTSYLPLL